jgi:uncharacterized protein YggT (Ycf19 family)
MSRYEHIGVDPVYVDPSVREMAARPAGWVMAVRIVSLAFGILQALLALRIVLLVLGADRANWLMSAILNLTGPFVEPFRGMFRLDHIGAGSASVLDVSAIAALIGWTLVEALILAIIRLADRRTYAGV